MMVSTVTVLAIIVSCIVQKSVKCIVCICIHGRCICVLYVGLVIGFDREEYMVFENQTQFLFGVRIFSGVLGTDVNVSVTVRLVNDTSEVDLMFSQSNGIIQQNITQNIQDNDLYNGMQTFSLQLSRSLQSNSNPNVTFLPSTSVINLIDNEGNQYLTCFTINFCFNV